MTATFTKSLNAYRQRGAVIIAALAIQVMGVMITVTEFVGLTSKGFRFLGSYAAKPNLLILLVMLLSIMICSSSLYVLVSKRKGDGSWQSRELFFSSRQRAFAVGVLAANALVLVVLVMGVLRYDVIHAQDVQPGQLGVAVAEFGEGVDKRSSVRGRELSAYVARSLRREIDMSPNLKGVVTVVSAPLVKTKAEAEQIAKDLDTELVIWGWVSETGEPVLAPSFTFVDLEDTGMALKEMPPWHETEISGDGTVELSGATAHKTSGLIEYVVGLVYLNQQDFDKALDDFERAIQLAETEIKDGDLSTHEKTLLKRTLAIYYLAKGRTLAASGDSELAFEAYYIAQDYDPEYGPTYIGLGNLDYVERRCEQALNWFQTSTDLSPERTGAWYSVGNAHFCLEQYEAAAAAYQEALKRLEDADPSQEALYYLVLGIAQCRMNQFEDGMSSLSNSRALLETTDEMLAAIDTEIDQCNQAGLAGPVTLPGTAVPTTAPSPTLVATPARGSTPVITSTTQQPESTDTPTSPEPNQTGAPSQSTPIPTDTPFPTTTPYPSPVITATTRATLFPTATSFPTATLRPTGTVLPTPIPTDTPKPPTSTLSPTPTATPTDIPLPTLFPTATPKPPPTDTPEATPTATPLHPPTGTPSIPPPPTPTQFPTTAVSPTPSETPSPTDTPIPTTNPTTTTIPPTSTQLPTATRPPIDTPEPTDTPEPETKTRLKMKQNSALEYVAFR